MPRRGPRYRHPGLRRPVFSTVRRKCLLFEHPVDGITQTELTEILCRVVPPSAAFLTAGMLLIIFG